MSAVRLPLLSQVFLDRLKEEEEEEEESNFSKGRRLVLQRAQRLAQRQKQNRLRNDGSMSPEGTRCEHVLLYAFGLGAIGVRNWSPNLLDDTFSDSERERVKAGYVIAFANWSPFDIKPFRCNHRIFPPPMRPFSSLSPFHKRHLRLGSKDAYLGKGIDRS